jgi:3',5'-cyclic-nucleotide phosphodiesterase
MAVTAFPLSHGGVESTAFLIESGEDALLCFGDTGPDEVEQATRLGDIWTAVAVRVRSGALRAIIIEVSYTSAQPDNQLFGHLTPVWLLKSLHALEKEAGDGSLEGLPVVVSHIKYSLLKGPTPQAEILKELEAGNDLGVRFIVPEQGDHWHF